ncbi:TPA: 3-isopropylmalate dehydratase small subunit [bacterium]|nr:3-isopropylmalate dehydratase small subunit [bacterium]
MKIRGRVYRFGDNVNTDEIIPARFLTKSNPEELAAHCFEDIAPGFSQKIQPGDIIVAGTNFGCGSSREHAPLAIKHSGIAAVAASSFARIFYRNAINIGLPLLEIRDVEMIEEGDELEIETETGRVFNLTRNEEYSTQPLPEFIEKIVKLGGLIRYADSKIK